MTVKKNNNRAETTKNERLSSHYILECSHQDYISAGVTIDVSEFWIGRPDYKEGRGHSPHVIGFTGRPGLSDDLFDTIKGAVINKKPEQMRGLVSQLRNFWRFLDFCEKDTFHRKLARVDNLCDIDTVHGVRWLRPMSDATLPVNSQIYYAVSALIRNARNTLGLAPLYWPPAPRHGTGERKDIPTISQGITLIKVLTKEAHKIWDRWKKSDELALCGRILEAKTLPELIGGGILEADLHATYREVIRRNGIPIPSAHDIGQFMGINQYSKLSMQKWWPKHPKGHVRAGKPINIENDLMPGMYPTDLDLFCLSNLFMARTGWNASTTFNLDCSSMDKWCRAYGEGAFWLSSYKVRGGSWQDTVSPENHAGHCYQIVTRLLKRNYVLRKSLTVDSSKCKLFDIATRSPWVSAQDSKNVGVLADHSGRRIREYLKNLIDEFNDERTFGDNLPFFKPSDFRDVFADAVHRGGNYSIFVTQISLGQKSLTSTRRYLRSRAWRAESEGKLHDLLIALFDQVEVHRKVDFTLLRAKMDGLQITQDQLSKLETYRKNRTYSGLGCTDPLHPPDWIDPGNPQNGSQVCKQGHRCPSCPNGKVFEESLPYLARYMAELEWKQKKFGDVRWYSSTDSLDFEVYRNTLQQWPLENVEAHLNFWRKKIDSGEHRVLIFSAGVE
jgi:hypothetical protein